MLDKVKQIKHFEQGIEFRFDAKDFKRLMNSIDVSPAQVTVKAADFNCHRGLEFTTTPQELFGLTVFGGYVLLQVVNPGLRFQDKQVIGLDIDVKQVAAVWKRLQAEMTIMVNLTPHDIHVWKDGKIVKTFPKSGKVARVRESYKKVRELRGIPIVELSYEDVEVVNEIGKIERLPLDAARRVDMVAPDTGVGVVRDDKGRILGTKRFVVFRG